MGDLRLPRTTVRDGFGRNPVCNHPASSRPVQGLPLQVLMASAVSIPMQLTSVYQSMGITRKKGADAVKALVHAGLAMIVRLPSGSRGGGLRLLQITDRGWEVLGELNVPRPKRPTHGGWLHNVAASAIGAVGRWEGHQVRCEYQIPGVRLDVAWLANTGKATFFLIGVSDPSREADSIIRAFEVPVVQNQGLVLVCRDRQFGDRVRSLCKSRLGKESMAKLQTRLVGQVLKRYYEGQDGRTSK